MIFNYLRIAPFILSMLSALKTTSGFSANVWTVFGDIAAQTGATNLGQVLTYY